MTRLTEKFANNQKDGRSHVAIALEVFRDAFFHEPPPPPEPAKLRVFATGLPRSGTGSLAVALDILGYQTCHGPGTFELAPIISKHYDSGEASHMDLIRHQEERGFDAVGFDMLGWKLFREAAKMPDVKIILTDHPLGGKAWAESFTSFVPDHLYYFSRRPFAFAFNMRQMMTLNHELLSYLSRLGGNDEGISNPNPTDPFFSHPGSGLSVSYEEHKKAVIEAVPEDRLLIFKPTDGWEPLCKFLGVEESVCPTGREYPHMTNRQMMMTMSTVAMVLTWIWFLGFLVAIVVPVWLGRKLYVRKKHKTKVS